MCSNRNVSIDAMYGGVGDFNGDGYFDNYVTDEIHSALLENQGDNTFIDVAIPSGTLFIRLGWGGNFFDLD